MASKKKWHSYVYRSIKVGLQDHFKEEAQPQPDVKKSRIAESKIQVMCQGILFVAKVGFHIMKLLLVSTDNITPVVGLVKSEFKEFKELQNHNFDGHSIDSVLFDGEVFDLII